MAHVGGTTGCQTLVLRVPVLSSETDGCPFPQLRPLSSPSMTSGIPAVHPLAGEGTERGHDVKVRPASGGFPGTRAPVFMAIAFVFVVLAGPCNARETLPWFDRVSLEQGLSRSTVHAVAQDRFGFLWVGGEAGLNRYDGYEFRSFVHDPDDSTSMSSNEVRAILADHGGRVWVGTLDGGLNCYDPRHDAFTFCRHVPGNSWSLSSDDVRALAEDSTGSLWIVTARGLDRLDPTTGRVERVGCGARQPSVPPATLLTAVAVDPQGRVWVGALDGVRLVHPSGDTCLNLRDSSDSSFGAVSALAPGRDGGVWVGTDRLWVVKIDAQTLRPTSSFRVGDRDGPPHARISSIVEDRWGRVWVGHEAGGLTCIELDNANVRSFCVDPSNPHCLSSSRVLALCLDRSDILWIGTDFSGLNRLDLKGRPFRHHRPTLPGAEHQRAGVVLAVMEDRLGNLWVGTLAGLEKWNRSTGEVRWFRPRRGDPRALAAGAVYALCEDREGGIWVGTWGGGLSRLGPHGEGFETFRHDPKDSCSLGGDVVMDLFWDSRGLLWVATWGAGLDRFDPVSRCFFHIRAMPGGLPTDYLHMVTEDRDGFLWVASVGAGLSRLDPTSERIVTYRATGQPACLGDDRVSWVCEGRDGALWVGTAGGLNRLDRTTGRFTQWRKRDGLPDDAVTALLEDEHGGVWVAHGKGISRLDPASGRIRNFDVLDGLQSTEFNAGAAFRTSSGEMVFGGVNGVTLFHPAEVHDNPYPPNVLITSVRVFGEPVGRGLRLKPDPPFLLHHSQHYLSFHFVGVELTSPAKTRYAYRLEGLDREYLDAGSQRFAHYAHVPPGRYVFRVKACNGSGVWSPSEAAVRIVIEPPFWRTWWFRLLAGASAVGVVAGSFAWRTRALRVRLAEVERLIAERTRELAEANRELEALSVRDPLTGLANRRRLVEFLEGEWQRNLRFGRPLSLLIIDVDHFKAYNDRLGHRAGDECLRSVAGVIAAHACRPGDLVARYGGEEFVVVLSETPAEHARALAERMRAAIEELALAHPVAASGWVTISIGVASTVPSVGGSWQYLLEEADRALYAAKRAGRNRVWMGDAVGREPS